MSFNRTPLGFVLAAKRTAPEQLAKTQPIEKHPVLGHFLAAILAGVMASGSPLAGFIASRKNQGQCSGCTAHAAAGCAETRANYCKAPPTFPISMREVYACTREWARGQTTPAGQPLPQLQDDGAELGQVVASCAVFGVDKFKGPSPDGRNSDIWTAADTTAAPPNVLDEADGDQLEAAAADPIAGAYTIDLTASDAVQKAIAALVGGFPLYCGFFCDSAFMNLSFGEVAQVPNQNDPSGGGHAVYIADFRASKTVPGTYEFLLVNSWGSWAGANASGDGCVWVSQAFFLAMWECWVWDEALIPARKAAA